MTDFNNMLKQAQELQSKMMDAQKKVEELEAEADRGEAVADGLVHVRLVGVKGLVDERHLAHEVLLD